MGHADGLAAVFTLYGVGPDGFAAERTFSGRFRLDNVHGDDFGRRGRRSVDRRDREVESNPTDGYGRRAFRALDGFADGGVRCFQLAPQFGQATEMGIVVSFFDRLGCRRGCMFRSFGCNRERRRGSRTAWSAGGFVIPFGRRAACTTSPAPLVKGRRFAVRRAAVGSLLGRRESPGTVSARRRDHGGGCRPLCHFASASAARRIKSRRTSRCLSSSGRVSLKR